MYNNIKHLIIISFYSLDINKIIWFQTHHSDYTPLLFCAIYILHAYHRILSYQKICIINLFNVTFCARFVIPRRRAIGRLYSMERPWSVPRYMRSSPEAVLHLSSRSVPNPLPASIVRHGDLIVVYGRSEDRLNLCRLRWRRFDGRWCTGQWSRMPTLILWWPTVGRCWTTCSGPLMSRYQVITRCTR